MYYVKNTNVIFKNSNIYSNNETVRVLSDSSSTYSAGNAKTIIFEPSSIYANLHPGMFVTKVYMPSTISYMPTGLNSQYPVDVYIEDLNKFLSMKSYGAFSTVRTNLYSNNKLITSADIILPDITTIPASMFYKWSGIKSITIPSSVTSIGNYAFVNTDIEHITIPSNVKTVGNQVFADCKKLTTITFEEGVEQIGSLGANLSLSEIIFPNSLLKITSSLFINKAKNLRKIKFGENIQNVNSLFVMNVLNHIDIDFSDCISIPTLASGDFVRYIKSYSIIVPDALYDSWIAATNWSRYASKIIKKSDWDAQQA